MNIKDWIKKNEKLYFFARIIQLRNNAEFRSWVRDISDSPSMVRVQKFGDNNPDELFYLIDIDDDGNHSGFFSLLNGTAKRLELANRLGAKPYIRWTNTPYSDSHSESDNAFSKFFIEPCEVSYDEVLSSSNVIKSRPQDGFSRDESQVYSERADYLEKMGKIYAKYLVYQPEITQLLKSDEEILKCEYSEAMIGIHVRGTDYRLSLKGHPKAILYEEYASAIDALPKEYYDKKIFLATDDTGAIKYFLDRFGDRVIYYQDVFRGDSDLGVHYMSTNRENHAFRLGYEVIRDVDTLSKCQALIAGVSFVSFSARAFKCSRNEKYGYLKIINHGLNNNGTTSSDFNRTFNSKCDDI